MSQFNDSLDTVVVTEKNINNVNLFFGHKQQKKNGQK